MTPLILLTPAAQIARFEYMLALCERYGWQSLEDLIFDQYIKLMNAQAGE